MADRKENGEAYRDSSPVMSTAIGALGGAATGAIAGGALGWILGGQYGKHTIRKALKNGIKIEHIGATGMNPALGAISGGALGVPAGAAAGGVIGGSMGYRRSTRNNKD